jgi:hypothetical protein
MRVETVQVPKHPRPGDRIDSNYEAELWREEKSRRDLDPEFATGPTPMIEDDPEPFTDEPDVDLELAAPVIKETK